MVNAEFRRDMQQNLLVLRDQDVNQGFYQEKVLEYNNLEGYLPFRVQRMDGGRILFYDLCGVQPLSEVSKRILPNLSQLVSFVEGILRSIQLASEYLLKEDDLLLSIEYMFVSLPSYEAKLCYYPGYQRSIKKQLSQLFEEVMSCVDYEDRNAVYLIYSLYMKSKDESCTVFDLEQILKSNKVPVAEEPRNTTIGKEPELQHYIANEKVSQSREDCINQDIPLAMSTCVSSMDSKAIQRVPQKGSMKEEGLQHKQAVIRPFISNEREEEREELYYPSKCYLFGGVIAVSIALILVIILKTNVLYDPVLKRLEPIKLVAFLSILVLPSIYGLKKVFDPKNKVSKMVSVGQYKLRELAATREATEFERGQNIVKRNATYEGEEQGISQRTVFQKEQQAIDREILYKEKEQDINRKIMYQSQEHKLQVGIDERLGVPDDHRNVSENKTMLLNGVKASPFAQLISEHPEKADSITLVECPFYIGTVKNQMNYSLSCPVISRYHAKIEKIDGIYYMIDLNSTNGNFVNGRRLKADEPNVLIAGDKVSFANICFIFACPN